MKIILFLALALAVRAEIEGPACTEAERYDCAGSAVPVADPNDCSIFYNCDPQIQRPCPSSCPPGLFYDPVLGICNWPEAVPSCSARKVREVEGPACTEAERYDCAGSAVPVADPNDCSIFYNCDPQIQRPCPSSCPPGLFYDPALGICNWPEAVPSCSARKVREIEGPACTEAERYDCAGSAVPVADPNDCSIFYNCDPQIQRPCPSSCPPGLFYDPVLGICNWPEAVPSCSARKVREVEGPACTEAERYDCAGSAVPVADPNDCSIFYNCDPQIQRPCPSSCPPGLFYDPVLGICNWPEAVPSCSARSYELREEGPACADDERYDCDGAYGRVRDEVSCSTFYNCDANVQHPCPSYCPPGLVFNTELEICDWPYSVEC